MDDPLAYFLDLRLRLRGRPQATAIVDRCLRMIALAETATPAEFEALQREADALRGELEARFGVRPKLRIH